MFGVLPREANKKQRKHITDKKNINRRTSISYNLTLKTCGDIPNQQHVMSVMTILSHLISKEL